MKPIIITHFATAVIITGIMLTIYATVQQTYRTAANDPQMQTARDIKSRLEKNKSIENLLPKDTIDLAQSLSIFVEFFDKNYQPLLSSGLLQDKMPAMPKGVYDFAKANGENVLTWQPEKSVRMAMVIESVQAPAIAYVAVGRSLKETEVREKNLVQIVFISWIMCLVILVIHLLLIVFLKKKPAA